MVYDLLRGVVRQSGAKAYLGCQIHRRVRKQVSLWLTVQQRRAMSRSLSQESEKLLGIIRGSAYAHEQKLYDIRKTRYPELRAEDKRHRDIQLEVSTAWAVAKNEVAQGLPFELAYSPTQPAADDSKASESPDNELFCD